MSRAGFCLERDGPQFHTFRKTQPCRKRGRSPGDFSARLPVVNEGNVAGVLTRHDLIAALRKDDAQLRGRR
jgi:CBS domain-containing protein